MRWSFMLAMAVVMCSSACAADSKVTIEKNDDKVTVKVAGALFTEHVAVDVPRPVLYPVLGPGGVEMIRHYPMKEGVEGEANDHVHHRSLWFTHGSVNGIDFWSEQGQYGKILQTELVEAKSEDGIGTIKTKNNWVGPDGKIVCSDERTMTFTGDETQRTIDLDIVIHASHGEVTFGDTKEGSMAIRTNPQLRLSGKVAKGHAVNANGDVDGKVWGKRAGWLAYWAPIDEEMVGLAIFDHPENPRHPTWWHARTYGLIAANPFGEHDFEKKPPGTGDLKIAADDTLRLRYRFVFFKGTAEQAEIAEQYETYKNAAKAKRPALAD